MTTGFSVIPVPSHGAEDVVVATHGPDEGAACVREHDGRVWMGSLEEPAVAVHRL